MQRALTGFAGLVLGAGSLRAEVVRVDVDRRTDILGGRPFGKTGAYFPPPITGVKHNA